MPKYIPDYEDMHHDNPCRYCGQDTGNDDVDICILCETFEQNELDEMYNWFDPLNGFDAWL